jgi:hypothetical protein
MPLGPTRTNVGTQALDCLEKILQGRTKRINAAVEPISTPLQT